MRQKQQDSCTGNAFDELREEGEGRRVDPVQILEESDDRRHRALSQEPFDEAIRASAFAGLRGSGRPPCSVAVAAARANR